MKSKARRVLLAVITIPQELVVILTFGYVVPNWSAWLLFNVFD